MWLRRKPEINAVVQQIGEGQSIPADKMALDIGPKTIELFSEEIFARAHDLVERADGSVRGPGVFAKAHSRSRTLWRKMLGAISIVGGGDSVAAVHAAGRGRQDHAHLDRRRRVAGISGRKEAAGS